MGKGSVIVAAVVSLGLTGLACAAVEVTPFRLEDQRSVTLMEDTFGRTPDRLEVMLNLKGPEADSSIRYGNVKLLEAVDDRGTDLTPPKSAVDDPARFEDYSNAFFRNANLKREGTAPDPQITLQLGLPKRAASRIARLRGTFDLAQKGTIKTVELTQLLPAGVKKLDIPAEAGIGITITVRGGQKDIRSVELQFTGDENALESIEVLDSAGEKVSNGMSSWSLNDGPVQKSIDLDRPLDGSMKLVAKVAMDRKVVTVPFDLKDIALP